MKVLFFLKSKNFSKRLVVVFAIFVSMGQVRAQACIDSSLINPFAICPLIYAPVCGCNNVTYDNSCVATNSGVTSWTQGECSIGGGGCIDSSLINLNVACPLIYAPVCGCDGVTYGNTCEAQNYGGVTSWTQGPCNGGSGCIDSSLINPNFPCSFLYAPVCGCDGITYGNECEAENYGGVTSWTQGPCNGGGGCIDSSLIDPSIFCATVYDPVCGCNGITYGNACEAEFWNGVTSWTPGPCGGGSGCIDSSLINIGIMCPAIYEPVCGCDGITYENTCFATNYGGVTSWTQGPCEIIQVDPCTSLDSIDFGPCDMWMGYGQINGVCVGISGCGPIVNGIDYSNAIFATSAECDSACNDPINFSPPCLDLDSVDFGICAMPLGIANINGQCVMLSGCGYIVNNIDYSPSFYSTMDSCQACLPTNQIGEYTDLELSIYPNPTNGKLTVKLSSSIDGTINVIDVAGRILVSEESKGLTQEMDLSHLSAGTYYLQVKGEGTLVMRKIVKH